MGAAVDIERWERVKRIEHTEICEFCYSPIRKGAWAWKSPRNTHECNKCRKEGWRQEAHFTLLERRKNAKWPWEMR